MLPEFRTVWLLALVNAIAMSASPLMVLIGSIIGTDLAPDQRWATLPIAAMVIGTSIGVVPAARGMAKWGRKYTFIGFICLGLLACFLAGQALTVRSFTLFCLAAAMLGITNAALQQIRFAAMESVALEKGPTAASIVGWMS